MMVPESSSDTDMPSAHPAGAISNDAGTTTPPPALAPGDDAPMTPGTGDDPSIEAGTVPPQSAGEPERPPSMPETPTVPSHQKELYTPATTETFQQRRARVDRQETLSFYQPATGRVRYGPNREVFDSARATASPYTRPPAPDPEEALTLSTFDTDLAKADQLTLPPGWTLENGFLTLEDPRDEWTLHSDKLIRKHYEPRDTMFDPSDPTNGCPLPLHYLSKDRVTKAAGYKETYDRWKQQKDRTTPHPWTGQTIFKILPAYRRLAMDMFYNLSGGHSSYIEPTAPEQVLETVDKANTKAPGPKAKARKDQLSERHMSLADRMAFMEAKRKELESFFKMMFGKWCKTMARSRQIASSKPTSSSSGPSGQMVNQGRRHA